MEDIDDYMKYVPPPDEVDNKKRKYAGNDERISHKSIDTMMVEKREEGMGRSIAADNIGYKLYQKFGFKPTTTSISAVPLKPVIRQKNERTGVGILTKEEKQVHVRVESSKHIHQLQENFKDNIRRMEKVNSLQRALGKADRILSEFRERAGAVDGSIVWVQEDGDELALNERLAYLRDNYYYCMYCSHQYENINDLTKNCPGISENSHE